MTDRGRPGPLARLAAYFALLFAFLIVGQFAVSFLPRHPLGWATWIAVAASALAAGWIVVSHLDDRPIRALGFTADRPALAETASGALVGSVLILMAAALLFVTGSAVFRSDMGSIADYAVHLGVTLVFFGIAAAAEELLFRGYAFQALVEWMGTWPAVLLSSAVFSWMHGGNPGVDPIAFGNIFLAGILLALAYLRTRSLWFATAVHTGWNWTMATLLDFPVSGLTSFDTPLYDAVARGEDWWTGGGFGPEAGVAGTIALLAGTAWLLVSPRIRASDRLLEARPLVDARSHEFERLTLKPGNGKV